MYYLENSYLLQVLGLTNEVDGEIVDNASVSAVVEDATGSTLLSANLVNKLNGNYEAILPKLVSSPTEGGRVVYIIDGGSTFYAEAIEEVRFIERRVD